MAHEHQEYVAGCFSCKVKTLQWGIVPGAYRFQASRTMYDAEALPDMASKEEVLDIQSDINRIEPEPQTFWMKDEPE